MVGTASIARTPRDRTSARAAGWRARSNAIRRARAMPAAKASAVGSGTSTPVTPSMTVSSAPPRPSAIDRPSARLRFDGHDAEVLFAGQQHRRRAAIEIAHVGVGQRPEQLDVGAGAAASRVKRRAPGRRRRCAAARPTGGSPRWRGRCACRERAPTQSAKSLSGHGRAIAAGSRNCVSTGG